ncbi:hypothetical protein BGAL_0043g00180 [Botrytis galanthina]|uniref:Uncharacterized protein n=1 Tax=Botrytis galanthina TaxID=278940 RepID=A0A4S8R9L1_9HELO|nr:hypothetical protein BGAL_0043g00180 [Botrytis galanthina]
MPESVAEINNPKYDFLYANNNQINYLEILQYPSQPVRRLEGELKDDRSLEHWLAKVGQLISPKSLRATNGVMSFKTCPIARASSGLLVAQSGSSLVANSCSTGKGWSNANATSPDDWSTALPFTKNSYSTILSASSFNIPSNLLQIHDGLITRSFKTTSKSCQNETTITFKLGSAINNWDLLTLTKSCSTGITTGIFLAHEDIDIVPLPFNVDSYLGVSQPWCIARLFIRHKLERLDVGLCNMGVDIDAVESATGQHNRWVDTEKIQNSNNQDDENDVSSIDPLHIDFIGPTTDLSKAEYVVAGNTVCIKALLLATKVLDELDQEGKQTIEELRDHCEHMLLKIEHLQMRMDALLSVIQQFQAEASARRAIFLTEASADLAKASRKDSEVMKIIAIDTKRDSKAMKTIAILGMVFLPGTFIASVFAMPVFTWTPEGSMIIQKGFGYYWAVTIPLTLIVLMAWGVSMLIPHRHKGVLSDDIELESLSAISINKRPINDILRPSNSLNRSRELSIDGARSQISSRHSQRSSNHRARLSTRSLRNSASS